MRGASLVAMMALAAAQPAPPSGGAWVLTFEDDFPGTLLNESVRVSMTRGERRPHYKRD